MTESGVAAYRSLVALDEAVDITASEDWAGDVAALLAGFGINKPDAAPGDSLRALHGLLARAEPNSLAPELVAKIEAINAGWTSGKPLIDPMSLPTIAELGGSTHAASSLLSVVVADITTIAADAIVNAANEQLLGCRVPNHACIDNAIHSAAGPRLRDDCAAIVGLTGGVEPVGSAKVTRAYALPSRYVLHTVGPRLSEGEAPSDEQRAQLASCYRSCLDVAAEVDDIRSIAFCGVSTGVFAFPKPDAASVALAAIDEWVSRNPDRFDRLVIDCFSLDDATCYATTFDREWTAPR